MEGGRGGTPPFPLAFFAKFSRPLSGLGGWVREPPKLTKIGPYYAQVPYTLKGFSRSQLTTTYWRQYYYYIKWERPPNRRIPFTVIIVNNAKGVQP